MRARGSSSRKTTLSGLAISAALVLSAGTAFAQGTEGSLEDVAPGAPTPSAVAPTESSPVEPEQPTEGRPSGDGQGVEDPGAPDEGAEAAPIPVEEAVELTRGRIDRFFDREPLGFSVETFGTAGNDLVDRAVLLGRRLGEWLGQLVGILAAIGLLLFAVLALWLDRRARSWLRRLAERATLPGPRIVTRLAAGSLRIAGRLLVPGTLLLLAYLLVRGLFDAVPWTLLLCDVLFLWLVYRALASLVREGMQPEVVAVPSEHLRRNRRTLIGAIWLVIVFRVAHAVLTRLDFGVDAIELLDFLMRLALTIWVLRLLVVKASVLALMPSLGPSAYLRLRQLLERYFAHVVVLTGALGLMWTFGYRHAALEILWRAYAIVAIVVAASLIIRWVQTRLRPAEEGEERSLFAQLVEAGGGYLRFFLMLILLYLALQVSGLHDPVVDLARTRLFEFGDVEFSVYLVARAVVYFVGVLLLSRLLRCLLDVRVFRRREVEEGAAFAIGRMVHYALVVVGAAVALLSTGLDLRALGLFAGALGVGIGFGLQEIVRDVVSGFVLLFGRAVQKGDIITAGERFGEVQLVGARSVKLRTPDHIDLLIPTSTIVHNTIVNWTHSSPQARIHVSVGTTYKADPSRVKEVLLAAAAEYPHVAKQPPPRVWLTNFGDSSVDYELIVWVNVKRHSINQVKGEIYFVIWDKLHEAGIEIPFPQRDLHIKSIEPDLFPHRGGEATEDGEETKESGEVGGGKGAKTVE